MALLTQPGARTLNTPPAAAGFPGWSTVMPVTHATTHAGPAKRPVLADAPVRTGLDEVVPAAGLA